MTSPANSEDRWFPASEEALTSVTTKDASNAIAKWWNASFDFQRSEKGIDSLAEACAFNLMTTRGEDGFTEKELDILVRKIQELQISCTMGELIAEGLICVSLVETSEELSSYTIAFKGAK